MSARVAHFGWGNAAPQIVATSTVNGLAPTPYETWAYRRAEITAFVGSPFRLPSGNPLTFARVRQLDPRLIGADRLEALSILTLEGVEGALRKVPRKSRLGIVICLPERMDVDRAVDRERRARRRIESRVAGPFVEAGYEIMVRTEARGHASTAFGLMELGELMKAHKLDIGVLFAVDSYYDPHVLEELFAHQRVLDSEWRDAFVPGEAGVALVLARPEVARQLGWEPLADVESVATNKEAATLDNDVGNLGLGLSRPTVAICKRLKQQKQILSWWISDATGESFRINELQIAWPRAARLAMAPGAQIDLLPTHLGDIGAATMGTATAVAIEGLRRDDPAGNFAMVTGSSLSGDRGVVLIGKREPRNP